MSAPSNVKAGSALPVAAQVVVSQVLMKDLMEKLKKPRVLKGISNGTFVDGEKGHRIGQTFSTGSAGTLKRARNVINRNEDKFRVDFMTWLESNWLVWDRFCGETERVTGTGRKHYSARTIVEYIRHETALMEKNKTVDGVDSNHRYKVNNSYVPDMGRLYGLMNRSHKDFFECRQMLKPLVRKVIRGRKKHADQLAS